MSAPNRIAFVGQGPNRACWERGLRFAAFRVNNAPEILLAQPPGPERMEAAYRQAERWAARVAITGRVGEALAALTGQHRLRFYATHDRLNLNARFNGKRGAGDVFLRPEGEARAREIAEAGYRGVVMLGAEVTGAFGWPWEPLRVFVSVSAPTRYLAFPHPSGLNRWWNEPGNRARAGSALKDFLK